MSDPLDDYAAMTKRWIAFLQHYKDGELVAPVEPPVLSRAAIDEMIDKIAPEGGWNYWCEPTQEQLKARAHDRLILGYLADAILESLSQEAGE
jgi:hypothetical protein